MLKNINPVISPELLKILAEMGHGDSIVIADGNFPAHSKNKRIIRSDACGVPQVLEGILSLIPLDTYVESNVLLMDCENEPPIWKTYRQLLKNDDNARIAKVDRFSFYEQAEKAYCVVATGETETCANILLVKGVVEFCPGK